MVVELAFSARTRQRICASAWAFASDWYGGNRTKPAEWHSLTQHCGRPIPTVFRYLLRWVPAIVRGLDWRRLCEPMACRLANPDFLL